jgi:ATP-dependent Clp protease adaptor protein ClpS
MSSRDPELDDAIITGSEEETEEKVEEPPLYNVVLHNDDFTPMDFVELVLREVFHFSFDGAAHMMLKVHLMGRGIIGTYPFEIAETKVQKATRLAREYGHPLLLTIEEAVS